MDLVLLAPEMFPAACSHAALLLVCATAVCCAKSWMAKLQPRLQVVLVALPGVDVGAIEREVQRQCDALPRSEVARQALAHSCIIVAASKVCMRCHAISAARTSHRPPLSVRPGTLEALQQTRFCCHDCLVLEARPLLEEDA